MNKLQAMNWLIEKVTRWPLSNGGVKSTPEGWAWGQFYKGDIQLYKLEPTVIYADCHIEQQEWLDGASPAKIDRTIDQMVEQVTKGIPLKDSIQSMVDCLNRALPPQVKAHPKKIYIAGPMTGHEDFNRPAFNDADSVLSGCGNVILNPAILPDGLSQPEYMQICLAMVMCADAIYLLKGWENSKGAMAELSLAEKLNLEIIEE